jgi:membrane protein
MIGKPRPTPDRASSEAQRQPSSGALTGLGGPKKPATSPRSGRNWFKKQSEKPLPGTMRSAAADAQKSRLPQMAAALSYRTIFGLLPVIIVALVAVKYFASEEHVRTAVEKGLEYSGLSAIAVPEEVVANWDSEWMGPPPPTPTAPPVGDEPAAVAGMEGAGTEGGAAPAESRPPAAVDKWITGLIDGVNKVSLKAIGLAGAIMLIYAAMAMLVEIELAFNQIYRVPRGRSWARRVMQYWTLLTLGPLGLVATFFVSQQYIAKAQAFAAERGVQLGSGTLTTTLIGYAITVAISTTFFFVAYITVPNTKVKIRPALMGALAAALLWEAGKWGFTQYLSHFGGTAKLYGALALLPLFLLWVYFTWIVVLFGLQIAYQLQHGRANTRAQPIAEYGPALVDPAAALAVLTAVARGFDEGKTLDATGIAKSTALAEPVVRLVVGKLAERGMLHRIDHGADDEEPTYALARSPSTIRVSEVLELGYELAGTTQSDESVMWLHRAQIESVGEQTLASLIGSIRPGVLPGGLAAGPESRTVRPETANGPSKGRTPEAERSRPGGAAATLAEQG